MHKLFNKSSGSIMLISFFYILLVYLTCSPGLAAAAETVKIFYSEGSGSGEANYVIILKEPAVVTARGYDTDGFSSLELFLNDNDLVSRLYDTPQSVVEETYLIYPTSLPDGKYTISALLADINFASTGKSLHFIIDNILPVADAGVDKEVYTGEEVIFDASVSRDASVFIWDFGDGTIEPCEFPYSVHTYSNPGRYTVTLTVYDDAGNISVDTAGVRVWCEGNIAPSVGPITAPTDPVLVNTEIQASISFTDSDVDDTHTAAWDWGDGTTSEGTVTEINGSGSVCGRHTYTTAGVYTVKVTVTDLSGNAGQSFYNYVVVYDPGAGYVTGGGWINSPAGAHVGNPALTGKANSGFVSKYQKGATVPVGQTQFQFKVANLNFHSDSYDWLVIAGAKAQYKGTGTINGSGNYGFMLTAVDGQVSGGGGKDKFRIKIWDKNNNGAIVYDNQIGESETADPVTALGGGSIVIHKE